MEKRKPVAQFTNRRYPYMRIRDLKFNAGLLLVYSESDAELIRECSDFGVCIEEVGIVPAAKRPEAVQVGGGARQGTQSTASVKAPEEPPKPTAEPAAPEAEDESVVAKPGGWYEYKGKNYRKSALPSEVRDLV